MKQYYISSAKHLKGFNTEFERKASTGSSQAMQSVKQVTERTQVILGGQQVRGRIRTSIRRRSSRRARMGDRRDPSSGISQASNPTHVREGYAGR